MATYYIATDGDDSRTKVQAQVYSTPWLTIQKGLDNAVGGDTVIVKDGVYTNGYANPSYTAVFYTGGSIGNILTLKAENKWCAILDGNSNAIDRGLGIANKSSYITIENFEIRNYKWQGWLSNESSQGMTDITIRGCHVHNIGRECSDSAYGKNVCFMNWVDNLIIENNIFNDIGRYAPGEFGCTPTIPYYKNHDHALYLEDLNYCYIRNNLFYNINRGWGVHLSDPGVLCDHIYIYNNTFDYGNMWDTSGAYASHINFWCNTHNFEIKNNIFNTCVDHAIWLYWVDGYTFTGTISNNIVYGGVGTLFYNATPVGVTCVNNLLNTNPLLNNHAAYDFTLSALSPARNAGIDVGLLLDYNGNPYGSPPSMGAYEYTGDLIVPGASFKHFSVV